MKKEGTLTQVSMDEDRALRALADQAKAHVPLFNGGDNGIDAPVSTRRQFFKTTSGVIAVSFMPVFSLGPAAAGCDSLGAFLVLLFRVLKSEYFLGGNDPVGGQMAFDNQTGGVLNLMANTGLLDMDRNSTSDENSYVLGMGPGQSPVYEYGDLNPKDEGTHQTTVEAYGANDQSTPFSVKSFG